ncbi:hypothetical protein GPECTOR_21g705 [Gonium pectorale]|uniref:Uncharacterized protein n=1 Tax=Gonium pectorale TaxID=33097 RepID=A0A150GI76_GONPE|nr:hypothetical protein GPECTOR_21g705 [Gonium pectorale]|eukprot:KXZ49479.1 hypothetical protein GPECTOR_21g705 [Gonium pectorale]
MALQVFSALRNPQRFFALAPVAEELVPLLLLGRNGRARETGERVRSKWAQLLQALTRALVANMSIARGESPPIVQAFTHDGSAGPVPPVLNAPTAMVLTLAARLLSAMPRELWAPDVVPPALADTLGACARDEVLSALLPGLRGALLPLLEVLRPDVPGLLGVAAAGEAATQAGADLVRQVHSLHTAQVAPRDWLQLLDAALPALHLPNQDRLLEAMIQGLAIVCFRCGDGKDERQAPQSHAPSRRLFETPQRGDGGSPGGVEAAQGASAHGGSHAAEAMPEWAQAAEAAFLELLSHESSTVALACYSLLEGLAQDASFRPADVSNLLAILSNAELAMELRRSAAEQMMALAGEARLREVLEEEASLWTITCIAALRDPSNGAALTASQADALAAQGLAPPTPDLLSTLDVQLPLAAINLLFVLTTCSPRVRAWLSNDAPWTQQAPSAPYGNAGRSGAELIMGGVLPLVFHSLVTVRRAVARLLASLTFGGEADKWSGWAPSAAAEPRKDHVIPAGGAGARQAGVTGSTSRAGDVLLLPQPFQRRHCFPCKVSCLAAVEASTTHAECTEALYGLQLACASRTGIEALAAADWQTRLDALLSTSPASPEDVALWTSLLEVVQRMLLCGVLSQHELSQLAALLRQSAPAVLSAPDAAADPPGVPLALADSEALPDFTGQYMRLTCTQLLMETLVSLIRSAHADLPLEQAVRVLSALAPTQLLQTLAAAYIGNDSANFGCRALAVQLLLEVVSLLAAAQKAGVPHVLTLEPGLQDALLASLHALLGTISGSLAAGAVAAAHLVGGGGSGLVDRSHERQAGGFAGKGAVRAGTLALLHLTDLLPVAVWTSVWTQLSGSFWVSRLLRDRDAVLRALAAEVLARLMQPGADSTHLMVAQGWPDAAKMMAKAALDRANCYALRTAALRVLCGCMAQSSQHSTVREAASVAPGAADTPPEAASLPRRQLFSSATGLPPAALLLQQAALWTKLPAMLCEPDAPTPFLAAVLSLLLQGTLLDGEGTVALLRQPGMVDRLLHLLHVGVANSAMAKAPASAKLDAAARGDRAAVIALLCWACRRSGAIHPAAQHANSEVDRLLGGWAKAPAGMQLEQCAGLRLTMYGEPEGAQHDDPGQLREQLWGLHCSTLAAQLLAHTQQEPPLLPLPSLGHSNARAASTVLEVFARVGACVPALDATRGLETAAEAPERSAKLEAALQLAAAGNAVLQQLEDEEVHQVGTSASYA